jgi:hypothetical protein
MSNLRFQEFLNPVHSMTYSQWAVELSRAIFALLTNKHEIFITPYNVHHDIPIHGIEN